MHVHTSPDVHTCALCGCIHGRTTFRREHTSVLCTCIYACMLYIFLFRCQFCTWFADKRLQLLAMFINHDEPDANKLWDYPLVVKYNVYHYCKHDLSCSCGNSIHIYLSLLSMIYHHQLS